MAVKDKKIKDMIKDIFEGKNVDELTKGIELPKELVQTLMEDYIRSVGKDIEALVRARDESLYHSKDSTIKIY